MKLAVILTVLLSMATTGHALQCYACKSKTNIAGTGISSSAINQLNNANPCTDFNPDEPADKFKRTCPTSNDKGCMKATDKNDAANQMRGCVGVEKDECDDEKKVCFCKEALCNGSGRGWPSAVLLLAALIAAGLGARH